jgi:anaerobic selenocysteine-containing dehydrogenase
MVVSFSSFMDETAMSADMILPNHVYLERYEDVPAARGFPQPIISLVKPVVEPLLNTRHSGDVIIQMAKQLGGTIAYAFPWDSYDACLEETLGDKWDTLVEEGLWIEEDFAPADWAEAFETESAKFEFTNKEIEALPQYNPLKAKGDESHFPLVLISYDSMRLTNGYIGSPPFLIKSLEDYILQANDVLVEVNPATAKEFGLKDGRFAILRTPKGLARVKVRHYDGIGPGIIAMPSGLGHTADDRFVAGKGVNSNTLIGPTEDPASGYDAAWGIRARLTKA